MKPLEYSERAPCAALAAYVRAHWRFDVSLPADETVEHLVWPDGCVSIAVVCAGGRVLSCTVTGPRVHSLAIPMSGRSEVFGMRLQPWAAGSVLGTDPASLRDQVVPARDVLGSESHSLADAVGSAPDDEARADVWERWAALRIARGAPLDDLVQRVAIALDAGAITVAMARAAEGNGVGERQLQRRFLAGVGLTPKEFARVRRVRAAILATLHGAQGWSALAAQLGFADQPHLAREVRAVTGLSPRELATRLHTIAHADVAL